MQADVVRRSRYLLGPITSLIATGSAAPASTYSNQRKIDSCQNGVRWAIFWDGSTNLVLEHSLDDGKTWVSAGTIPFSSTGTSYIPNASLYIDLNDIAHVVYKDRSNGYIYYRKGTPNLERTSYTWSSAQTVESASGANYPDIVAHDAAIHIVYGRTWSVYTETTTTEYEWAVNPGYADGDGDGDCSSSQHSHADALTAWSTSNTTSPWGSSYSYSHTHMVWSPYEGTGPCNGYNTTHSHSGTPYKTGNTRTVSTGGYYSYYAYIYYRKITDNQNGSFTVGGAVALSANYGNVTEFLSPSIDFHHTGDAKTVANGTPHLYVAWSSAATGTSRGIRFRKATYSAGNWTWGTDQMIDSSRYVLNGSYWLNCLFDGVRVIIVGQVYEGGTSTADLMLYDRDVADTFTSTRILISNNTDSYLSIYGGSASYDDKKNVHIVGRNHGEAAGANDLVHREWDRALAALSEEMLVNASVGEPYVSAKRGSSERRFEFIYTDGTASPYEIFFEGRDV